MAKKKSDHVIIRNSEMFCSHCGQSQAVPYPILIPVFVAMCEAFTKMHLNCPKKWSEPVADPNSTTQEKAEFWYRHGERGMSSEFMFQIISGRNINAALAYPHDPSDFKRCYGLLKTVPEWKNKLDLMRPTSDVWNNLVDNWDKLSELLEEQMQGAKDNGMYNLMKRLGC